MKTNLLCFLFCCFFECAHAQKQPKYTIEIDEEKEYKYETATDQKEYCYMHKSLEPIPCKDTIAKLLIVYNKGLENYVSYYSNSLKRIVEIDNGEPPLPIDTAWLKKHVRHVTVHFYSGYLDPEDYNAKEQNPIDSVNFIKEWPLFERFLGEYKQLQTLSIHLNSKSVTQYLQQSFHLPLNITKLKKLENLEIHCSNVYYAEDILLPQEVLKIKHLRRLAIRGCGVTGLEQLRTHKTIKELKIKGAVIVSHGFPLWLYEMSNLEVLYLSFCFEDPITGPSAYSTLPKGISKLKNLHTLSLGYIGCGGNITHLPVEELCSMKKLEKLHVYSPPFFYNKTQVEQLKKHLKSYFFSTMEF